MNKNFPIDLLKTLCQVIFIFDSEICAKFYADHPEANIALLWWI